VTGLTHPIIFSVVYRFRTDLTFQGLMPYYFQVLYPGRALELNWCVWDNMCVPSEYFDPRLEQPVGTCYSLQAVCENCSSRPITEIGLIHFTECGKPWRCQKPDQNSCCWNFHNAWFKTRSAMEQEWGRSGAGPSTFEMGLFLGYCSSYGSVGYHSLAKTCGSPTPQSGWFS
jgi:hypothetical protein